ncbi:MAG: hypothetical protein EXQ47_00055 [Bryobacterales bacterium]|nr:hypothetical protein [Bryobacterales bacterium]
MKRAVLMWVLAGLLARHAAAQITPYSLQVQAGPGLLAFTFSVRGNQVRAYVPDDVAPGERFSGTLEGPPNFVFELGGQSARVGERDFSWVMPAGEPGEFVPLVLKDFRGQELGRASVRVAAPGPAHAAFRFPKFVHAGHSAPILGPFDGDSGTTAMLIGGEPARVLAESPRKVVVRAPEHAVGPVAYTLRKGSVEKQGDLRALDIKTTPQSNAKLAVAVHGLAGLADEVALRLETDYIFIHPSDVNPEGAFETQVVLWGMDQNVSARQARLVFAQTPRDEVGLILREPNQDRRADPALQHVAALKTLDFDPFPALESYLTDFDLGNDAAYAMLALDEERAMRMLLASMPRSGANIERLGLIWFVRHYTPAAKGPARSDAHAAALRILSVPSTASETVELAMHTLGLSGTAEDIALLEQRFRSGAVWAGGRRIQDASEAAMARLGSTTHLESIRNQLSQPVPEQLTPQQATFLSQLLDKAGFAGRKELLPAVCPHLSDPAAFEIDVTWDPKPRAMAAVRAIATQTTPISIAPRKTIDEWKDYCRRAQ